MLNKVIQGSEESEFLLSFLVYFFPIATVVVAHSPTPSKVKTIAFSNGEGKKHCSMTIMMF